ncbi:MAG: class I SAM-dependent methyltransferase [Promethearchaeota archaeon]|jgi:cyclopropane fatty-acyl-phospholipid synthase-like methyltransferase
MNSDSNQTYWNNRFSIEGKIWGELPSKSALYALEQFKNYKIKNILIPGSGYGRHTKFFSQNKYTVVGIEISKIAYEMALKFDPQTNFINDSVMNVGFIEETFDAIFCFNTLHLFMKNERHSFLEKCYYKLKRNGLVFFTVFSEKELSIGKGKELEYNTYESKKGRPTHYFTEEDLNTHFKDYVILETGIIDEKENHGEQGSHSHLLRYIFAQK